MKISDSWDPCSFQAILLKLEVLELVKRWTWWALVRVRSPGGLVPDLAVRFLGCPPGLLAIVIIMFAWPSPWWWWCLWWWCCWRGWQGLWQEVSHLCFLPHCFQQDCALEVATLGPERIYWATNRAAPSKRVVSAYLYIWVSMSLHICVCKNIFKHLVDRCKPLQPMNWGTGVSHLEC